MKLIVGLDPGVHTGFCAVRANDGAIIEMSTLDVDSAWQRIQELHGGGNLALVRWEDARLRRWFGKKGREALMGAGSIRRECGIWENRFLKSGIPNEPLPPQAGGTKWDAPYFAKVTGWQGRTSNHSRDAACLVIGYRYRGAA